MEFSWKNERKSYRSLVKNYGTKMKIIRMNVLTRPYDLDETPGSLEKVPFLPKGKEIFIFQSGNPTG
jgi:hypothetical protein